MADHAVPGETHLFGYMSSRYLHELEIALKLAGVRARYERTGPHNGLLPGLYVVHPEHGEMSEVICAGAWGVDGEWWFEWVQWWDGVRELICHASDLKKAAQIIVGQLNEQSLDVDSPCLLDVEGVGFVGAGRREGLIVMRKPQMYRFDYLRRVGDVFFVGLKGPRGGVRSFPLASAEMARLLDGYFRSRGAPPREEREASWRAAREEVKAASFAGIPAAYVIAKRLGISVEEATAWWEQKRADASDVPASEGAGGDLVRLADAATARDARRRVELVERLAELEVETDAIAKGALRLVTDGLPAAVEAVKLALALPRFPGAHDADEAEGVVLERLVRADPERARRVLDSMTGPATGSVETVSGAEGGREGG